MAAVDSNSLDRRIRRLDAQVANQIAAGEVVERPASVVKELLENSIDAGATRVEVHLEDGGRALIRIVDNGRGIEADQVTLAFERHATSKISVAEDLARVATYGFRGEALASIASVARIEMTTRTEAQTLGTKVVGSGAGGLTQNSISCALGTDLRILDLFANVPARQAFMRTAATELGHVIRLLDAVALANLDLHLVLLHNGRKVSDYPPSVELMQRAATVLGSDVAKHLQIVAGTEAYRVDGALSAPSLSRGSSAGLTLIVDGRPVTDTTLVHAVRTAYGNRLPDRRHPVGVLCLRCPPATVDVNVHPGKTEVRFLSKQGVHAAVVTAVTDMLDEGAWLGALDDTLPTTRKGERARPVATQGRRRSYLSGLFDTPEQRVPATQAGRAGQTDTSLPQRTPQPGATPSPARQTEVAAESPPPSLNVTLLCAGGPSLSSPTLARFVGQSGNRWLLFETADDLVFVDRQAAFETVAIAAGGAVSQRLMIPVKVALGQPLVAAIKPAFKRLQRHGLEVVAATTSGVLVRAAPTALSRDEISGLVRRLAATLLAANERMSSVQVHAHIDSQLAQAVAPKTGDVIAEAQAAHVARALSSLPLPASLASGELSVVVVPLGELVRRARI